MNHTLSQPWTLQPAGAADADRPLPAPVGSGLTQGTQGTHGTHGASGPHAASPASHTAAGHPPAGLSSLVPALVTVHQPDSPAAEGFRTLRSQLSLRTAATGRSGGALAVLSPSRGDGRSWCAANLAVSMAQRGGPVLLVDANLRQPSLHAWLGLPGDRGLATVLGGRTAAPRPLPVLPVLPVAQVPGLFLLPAGAAEGHPLEWLESPAFAELLQQLAGRYAHVVVDTPAAELGADAAVIAAHCQAALLVVRQHHSRVQAVQDLCAAFAPRGTPVAGVFLNGH